MYILHSGLQRNFFFYLHYIKRLKIKGLDHPSNVLNTRYLRPNISWPDLLMVVVNLVGPFGVDLFLI